MQDGFVGVTNPHQPASSAVLDNSSINDAFRITSHSHPCVSLTVSIKSNHELHELLTCSAEWKVISGTSCVFCWIFNLRKWPWSAFGVVSIFNCGRCAIFTSYSVLHTVMSLMTSIKGVGNSLTMKCYGEISRSQICTPLRADTAENCPPWQAYEHYFRHFKLSKATSLNVSVQRLFLLCIGVVSNRTCYEYSGIAMVRLDIKSSSIQEHCLPPDLEKGFHVDEDDWASTSRCFLARKPWMSPWCLTTSAVRRLYYPPVGFSEHAHSK